MTSASDKAAREYATALTDDTLAVHAAYNGFKAGSAFGWSAALGVPLTDLIKTAELLADASAFVAHPHLIDRLRGNLDRLRTQEGQGQ